MEAFPIGAYNGSGLGTTVFSDLTQRSLGPPISQEIIIRMSDMVLLQFSTSKQIPALPAQGQAIIPGVWLGALELTPRHRHFIAIWLSPPT